MFINGEMVCKTIIFAGTIANSSDGKGGKVMCAGKMRVFCMLMNYVFFNSSGKCSSTLMLFGLEIFPLCLYLAVLFQFGVAPQRQTPVSDKRGLGRRIARRLRPCSDIRVSRLPVTDPASWHGVS